MFVDKGLISGSTAMLILKLLENSDMYGYQMIEEFTKKSNNVFSLKAGTLYPLLHSLEQKDYVTSYDASAGGARVRKYYQITKNGRRLLQEKANEWRIFASAVNNVLGGTNYATI